MNNEFTRERQGAGGVHCLLARGYRQSIVVGARVMTCSRTVDLERVARSLFETPGVLALLQRDYSFATPPASPRELAQALWREFGQTPVEDPALQRPTNQAVFRAAVRSIGSNSRAWSAYLKNEPALEQCLFGFDPVAVSSAVSTGNLDVAGIKVFLPGQSSTGDARAIIKWAKRLSGPDQFHEELRLVADRFRALAASELPGGLQPGELFLCVVGFFGYPANRWLKKADLPREWRSRSAEQWKLAGMGYALTSEMLRNLRWDGYKVDRHIMRLLGRWSPEVVESSRARAWELAELIGTTNRDLLDMLAYSLAGMKLAPEGVPRSHVDNLIWALGAYVEKKGHESQIEYLASAPADSSNKQHYLNSSFRERLIEHLLIGELLKRSWLSGTCALEVARPDVDNSGYDLILEHKGVMRHVQLKASKLGARTRSQNIHLALSEKPSGCVVWVYFSETDLQLGPFLFFGGQPGQGLPSLAECKVAKHSKGDSSGHKADRPNLRVVPKSAFENLDGIRDLWTALFGPEA